MRCKGFVKWPSGANLGFEFSDATGIDDEISENEEIEIGLDGLARPCRMVGICAPC
jgi:hypothetical protein